MIYIFFENVGIGMRGAVSGILAYVLSPGIKKVDSQSGEHIQVKFIFLKKTCYF
ncbi:hypothetical protein ACFQ0R_00675 [Psychroflexus salinarum]|uniref:Uncharacterized protein n=1 Tax=Psychroflexus salinarum TaxID=546024 RepID=A0ABW3GM36_9FLAO